jgi:hypothetical protein
VVDLGAAPDELSGLLGLSDDLSEGEAAEVVELSDDPPFELSAPLEVFDVDEDPPRLSVL